MAPGDLKMRNTEKTQDPEEKRNYLTHFPEFPSTRF